MMTTLSGWHLSWSEIEALVAKKKRVSILDHHGDFIYSYPEPLTKRTRQAHYETIKFFMRYDFKIKSYILLDYPDLLTVDFST